MSDIYPLGMTDKDLEDNDEETYVITIDDPLGKEYAKVRGIEFDTHATVTLCRKSKRDEPEITEMEMRSFHVIVRGEGLLGVTESFELKDSALRSTWKDGIEKEVERIATQQAKDSHRWERLDPNEH